MNEITVGSIYDDNSPVDTQALQFGEAQKADPDIVVVSGWCSSQMFPKLKAELMSPSDDLVQYWLSRKNLYLDEAGSLWRKRANSLEFDQLVVPRNLRQKLFDDCHINLISGHLGVSRTYARLNMHFYWPGMTDSYPHPSMSRLPGKEVSQ